MHNKFQYKNDKQTLDGSSCTPSGRAFSNIGIVEPDVPKTTKNVGKTEKFS